jgi:hypothetical protein
MPAFRLVAILVLVLGAATGTALGADYVTTADGSRVSPRPIGAGGVLRDAPSGRSGAVEVSPSVAGAVAKAAGTDQSCQAYHGTRAIGCALVLEANFDIEQMRCLERLWTRESGWNPKSTNASTGAYGIPQALPGDKMAAFGADWRTNPEVQIRWGLNYIRNRYRTPCAAWSHFLANNWY